MVPKNQESNLFATKKENIADNQSVQSSSQSVCQEVPAEVKFQIQTITLQISSEMNQIEKNEIQLRRW